MVAYIFEQWRRRRDGTSDWREAGEGLVSLGMSLVINTQTSCEEIPSVYAVMERDQIDHK